MYCSEQMQGESGLQMYCAEQIQEKLGTNVLYCTEQMQGEAVFLGEKENSWSRLSNIRAVCFS
jgi:hypothetical protein